MRRWRAGCRVRWGRVGSASVAGCRRSSSVRCRAGICRSVNARRSRCGGRRVWVCVRSLVGSGVRRRRFRRELKRNAATRGGKLEYRAGVAQWKAELMARRPKTAKLAADGRLRDYVADRLAAQIARPDGELVRGPEVRFAGRRHGAERTAAGRSHGASSRSRTASGSISPMMSPCGSPTKRSAKPSMSTAAAPCGVSSSPVCARAERFVCPERGLGAGARNSSHPRS